MAFDPATGNRAYGSVEYSLYNLQLADEKSTSTNLRFHAAPSVIVAENVTIIKPYIYFDNTTLAPPTLPPLEDQVYNLIPLGVLIYGWVLVAVVFLCSSGWMVWTVVNRKQYIVQASQPIFLCQLCLGTAIMALSVLPMGMQENSDGKTSTFDLDVACMAIPWLFFIGFVFSFSALFSKVGAPRPFIGCIDFAPSKTH